MAKPLATKALQNKLNHTYNGLLGQPTAIVPIAIAQPIAIAIATATATIPPETQSIAIIP